MKLQIDSNMNIALAPVRLCTVDPDVPLGQLVVDADDEAVHGDNTLVVPDVDSEDVYVELAFVGRPGDVAYDPLDFV